jgi:ABC-type sugar transport system substrate-binding protein
MRRAFIAAVFAAALGLSGAGPAVAAANPSGTGLPSQDCGDLGTFPGHTTTSPGSPFNEGVGTGGLHYTETSQYDVACFQVGQH